MVSCLPFRTNPTPRVSLYDGRPFEGNVSFRLESIVHLTGRGTERGTTESGDWLTTKSPWTEGRTGEGTEKRGT